MKKTKSAYVCSDCGATALQWFGSCPSCGAAGTLTETITERPSRGTIAVARQAVDSVLLGNIQVSESERLPTGIGELDRVLGGGLVAGQVVLIGGDPGIGKSTLLLQALSALGNESRTLYVSGEESAEQVALRARRLGLDASPVHLIAEIQLERIAAALDTGRPQVAVIDSIQTLWSEQLQSAPGSVAQVRECAAQLARHAKKNGIALFIIGHVTKEGTIAGPRVLEHMVDTVLYFEGERGHHFRILRAVKNRFGPTDEIGVFEMTDRGLVEVSNPSALFLGDREGNAVSGAAVFAGMEGTRPLLVEIQALVAPTAFGTPRRAVIGWDAARLHMVLAVLEARCGVPLAGRDVYLNVAGGLKVQEPAADLAVAAALL